VLAAGHTGLRSTPVGDGDDGVPAVELVGPEVVRPLRRAVLRPDGPPGAAHYPGDDAPGTAHAAVRDPGGAVLAVGTILPEAPPWDPRARPAWRIRGMAAEPWARRRGLGTGVLRALLAHAAAHGGGLVWCHARVAACHLYERAGFEGDGPVFELPGIGPHRTMRRLVAGVGPAPEDGPGLGRPDPPVPT